MSVGLGPFVGLKSGVFVFFRTADFRCLDPRTLPENLRLHVVPRCLSYAAKKTTPTQQPRCSPSRLPGLVQICEQLTCLLAWAPLLGLLPSYGAEGWRRVIWRATRSFIMEWSACLSSGVGKHTVRETIGSWENQTLVAPAPEPAASGPARALAPGAGVLCLRSGGVCRTHSLWRRLCARDQSWETSCATLRPVGGERCQLKIRKGL